LPQYNLWQLCHEINGRSALACQKNIASELNHCSQKDAGEIPEITIAPLGNLPIIRDLIVNMQPFWDDLEKVEPYISSQARTIPEREFLQTPEERANLNQMGNCISAGPVIRNVTPSKSIPILSVPTL